MGTSGHSYSRHGHHHEEKSLKRRKSLFFVAIVIFLLTAFAVLLFSSGNEHASPDQHITVGICGCIEERGVYRLPLHSDLATLIHAAKGVSPKGDLQKVDLDLNLKNDSIYHIPCQRDPKFSLKLSDFPGDFEQDYPMHEEKLINYLYIGFPAVYMLIQYSSEYKIVNVIYLPHSTVFMENEYRLIDIFFTLGINPTINILQNQLKQRIDYYFIQNKPAFITMIDNLGGLELNVDAVFADAYGIRKGKNVLDGWHTYEYISFIDQKRHYKVESGAKALDEMQFKLKDIELAYDLRQQRQLKVIQALYAIFKTEDPKLDASREIIGTILSKGTLDSNMDINAGADVFRILMQGAEISYGTLPGYYTKKGESVYYIPDGPGYDLLRNSQARALFELNKHKGEQVLY